MTLVTTETRSLNVVEVITAAARIGWRCPAEQVAVAALAPGPATTPEIRAAAGAALREIGDFYRWTGNLYSALQRMERDGHVVSVRSGPREPVLWALTGDGLEWGSS